MVEIIEVKTGKQFKDFLNFPMRIYQDKYPRYVQPLNAHLDLMIGKRNVPEKHLFLAVKNGEIVARAGFKVNRHGGDTFLHFGFYECLEGHQDATQALFEKGHSLYPNLKMRGPFQFRMEDPYVGTLVEGFDHEPYFLMSYNPPYYNEYLQSAGLSKVMDLFTYELDKTKGTLDPIIIENAARAKANGYKIRLIDGKRIREEAGVIARIFNDALKDNWGFEEFIETQVDEMVLLLKFFLDLRIITFVHKDGKDVGCLIMLPNFNPMLSGLNGKISPKLIWRYFRRFKFAFPKARGYAMGVLKEHHGQGIGSFLTENMFEIGPVAGYYQAEVSWVLANNSPMNELAKAMDGKQNKVYRIYEKSF